jgi:hypothetical protein
MRSKHDWHTLLAEWSGYVTSFMTTSGLSTDNALIMTYYDGELSQYRLRDYFATTTPYYTYADDMYASYGTYYGYNNTSGAHFTLPGYWVFGEGLAERYNRRSIAAALTDLTDMCTNAAFAMTGTLPGDTTDHELSREWAYCGMNKLQLKRFGALSSDMQTRLDLMHTDSLKIVNDWSTEAATYCRPFMAGLTAKFLIQFYELEASAGEKTTILAALEGLATYLWTSCWVQASAAFKYTNKVVVDPADTNPAPDLSMLVAPLYAWLWSITKVQDWKNKAEQIFDGGFPVYDGPWWQSGTYLGTRSAIAPIGKHLNQQLFFGGKFWDYYETAATGAATAGVLHLSSGLALLGCGGSVSSTPVTFNAADYGTPLLWVDHTDTAKVFNGSVTQCLNGEKIATIRTKDTTDTTYEQSTDGNRPTLRTNFVNGLQVGDYSSSWLESAGAQSVTANRAGMTFVLVLRVTTLASAQTVWEHYTNAGGYRFRIKILATTGAHDIEGLPQDAGTPFEVFGAAGNLSINTWYVLTWVADFAGDKLNGWTNTTQAITDQSMNSTGNTSSTSASAVSNLGYWPAMTGQIGDAILYNAALNATNRGNLITALKAKYGIT